MFLERSFEEISLDDSSTESEKSRNGWVLKKGLLENNLGLKNSCQGKDFSAYKILLSPIDRLRFNKETFDYENILKQLKPKSSKTPSNKTAKRLFLQDQIRVNRNNFLKQQQDLQQLKNCTFKPDLNKKNQFTNSSKVLFELSRETIDPVTDQLSQKSLKPRPLKPSAKKPIQTQSQPRIQCKFAKKVTN